jgi:hypothetical protein
MRVISKEDSPSTRTPGGNTGGRGVGTRELGLGPEFARRERGL